MTSLQRAPIPVYLIPLSLSPRSSSTQVSSIFVNDVDRHMMHMGENLKSNPDPHPSLKKIRCYCSRMQSACVCAQSHACAYSPWQLAVLAIDRSVPLAVCAACLPACLCLSLIPRKEQRQRSRRLCVCSPHSRRQLSLSTLYTLQLLL